MWENLANTHRGGAKQENNSAYYKYIGEAIWSF